MFFGFRSLTSRVLDKNSSDFLQKLVLVEISSKTRSFVDILILGHPIPFLLLGTFKFQGISMQGKSGDFMNDSMAQGGKDDKRPRF